MENYDTAQDAFTATEIAINDLYRMVADLQAEVEQLKGDSV